MRALFLGSPSATAVVAAAFLGFGLVAAVAVAQEPAPRPAPALADPAAEAPRGWSLGEFRERMDAALVAAGAALASEEARLDDLAVRNSRRTLADGRPSLGQAAANIRLWGRQIRELETVERELRDELNGVLTSLGPDIARLAQRKQVEQTHEAPSKEQTRRRACDGSAEANRTGHASHARGADTRGAHAESFSEYPKGGHTVNSRSRLPAPREVKVPEVGQRFRDCAECPAMVVIPPGSFQMGSPTGEKGRGSNEGPRHGVRIPAHLAVGVYEVTFSEWDACRGGGGCSRSPDDKGWGRGNCPVFNVSWEDAKEYAGWLSRKTGKQYRLLSESEWEYAARAGTTTSYSWGDEIIRNRANCSGCGSRWDNEGTAPVGSFPANAYGLYDVHGNASEWVEDCWHANYKSAPADGSAWTRGERCGRRVLRGGSWRDRPRNVRSAFRTKLPSVSQFNDIGFRVARELD